ncbi:MAG: SEC-C metal-binding domain-containing protein [Bacteroidota bacterium]
MIQGQLRRYKENSKELNGFLIGDLLELRAVEAVETIREAFKHGRVEIAIPGDLEDVEIELGLRIHRETPKPRYGLSGIERTAEGNTSKKAGRNDPCPCGSGKKYKKCCLNADRERTAD